MKLTWKQIEPFVKSPDPKARVIVIYGPDQGLIKERSQKIGKTIIDDLNDPFNVVTLTTDLLLEDPARLGDEANALSMMGGSRLIFIKDGSDKLSPLLKEYLEEPSEHNLIVIECGELGPRSNLRTLAEKNKSAAALPCYLDDERDISNLVRETLKEKGYFINGDVLHFFAQQVVGDRARIRNEMDKLMLYMGDEKSITMEHVQDSIGNQGDITLDNFVYAVASGQTQDAIQNFNKLIKEGIAEVLILRSLQNHFKKLHMVRIQYDQGKSIEEAVKGLYPPIFFKLMPSFKSQSQKWQTNRLALILKKLAELEAQTKKTGTPSETLCAQAILSISLM